MTAVRFVAALLFGFRRTQRCLVCAYVARGPRDLARHEKRHPGWPEEWAT
jgi:hypothetical protein